MSRSTELRVKELLREKGWTTKVLAEKTGMSESYLTHIKNGTRRWNEDSLKKLSQAFEVNPIDLFAQGRERTDEIEPVMLSSGQVRVQVQIVPVVGDIPVQPSAYNNQRVQETTGFKDMFIAMLDVNDESMFALSVEHNLYTPMCHKGDLLVISPQSRVRSGDLAAVEFGNETPIKTIMRVTYTDDFIVLESVNQKQAPIALVQGKDHFRIIGRLIQRVQRFA